MKYMLSAIKYMLSGMRSMPPVRKYTIFVIKHTPSLTKYTVDVIKHMLSLIYCIHGFLDEIVELKVFFFIM